MAKIFNPSITQDCRKIFNTKVADNISSQVNDIIMPVVEICRHNHIVDTTGVITATGTAAAHNSNVNKDTYITAIQIAYMKDAANDNTSITVTAAIDGATRTIIIIPLLTLVAARDNFVYTFERPLKIDRDTAINMTGAFTVGALTRACCIMGYSVETMNAGAI